jgi:hypothetical protein
MPDEVVELLDAMQRGDLTLAEVAQRFKERRWPRRRRPAAETYEQLAELDIQDPEPYLPGSFDDVAAAYHQKQISRDQFRVLSEAVAESQRAEDARDVDPG